MARSTLALLVLLGGCFESHELGGGLDDDGALDAGRRDFGIGRDLGRPGRDLGPPRVDAGSGCDRCVSEVIGWGPDGGLVFERQRWELSPCDRLLRRTDFSDGSTPELCTAELGALDCGALDAIETLVASPAVRALREAAPTVVGSDPRPVDGQILTVRIGGDLIGIGGECGSDPDCAPVPAEARELAEVLERVSDASAAPGACPPAPVTETFPCGEEPDAVSCLLGRDVCYAGRFDGPRCVVPGPEEGMCSGAPSCDCLFVSFAETCIEGADGEVVVLWVGP